MSIISEASYLISNLITFKNEITNDNHCILAYTTNNNMTLFISGTLLASKLINSHNDFAQLYYFPEKKYYVVIGGFISSCDGCMEPPTIEHIKNIIYKSYVINDFEKAQAYYDKFTRSYY
jgi:hypothetical protein